MELDALIARVKRTEHGFSDILRAANELAASDEDILAFAPRLYVLDVEQARMLAVYLFGMRAAETPACLEFLRETVSADPSWRVQEILAQAFDQYYRDAGYRAAAPVLTTWLADPRANVRRAVTEGLRIWTTREHFKDHPQEAIQRLAALKADESEYVRKSVGNALRDISRKHADLVRAEVTGWDRRERRIAQTYKLASKFLENG